MASFVDRQVAQPEGGFIVEELLAQGGTIDPFIQSLNMEVLWADPQEAEGILHVTPQVLNPYGTVHGGCLVALADSVAGHNMAAAGKLSVTQSSTVNFLRPAVGKMVYCRSKIQKLGRTSVVAVEQTDEEGTLLTTALFTFHMIKEIPPHLISNRESFNELSFMEK
jgi:acyl-CoA thioesterase